MEETIDYKGLYEGLQAENERLRLKIWGLSQASSFSMPWDKIRACVERNYTVLLIALFAFYYLGSLLIDAYRAIRGNV